MILRVRRIFFEAFTRRNPIPHYASLMLKMPGPRGIITLNGNIERSLRVEDRRLPWQPHTKRPHQLKHLTGR